MNLALRLILAVVPTLSLGFFLNVDYVHPGLYLYLAAGSMVALLPRPWRQAAGLLVFAAGGFVAATLILIMPYSAYIIWFGLVRQGTMRGSVSYTFMFLSGYLSLITASGIVPGVKAKPILQLLLANSLVLFIILRWDALLLLAGLLFLAALLSDILRRDAPAHALRGLAGFAGIAFVAAVLSLPLSHGREPRGVSFFDSYLADALRHGVLRVLPEFPILHGIPGYGYGFSAERLGGRPILSERPIFTVTGLPGDVHYLRAVVHDRFTGAGWSRSVVDPALLTEAAPQILADEETPGHTDIRIAVHTDFYPHLPHELNTRLILLHRPSAGLLASGDLSTGLTLKEPLLYGESLGLVPDHRLVPSEVSPLSPEARRRYTDVPDRIEPAIREIAARLNHVPDLQVPRVLAETLGDGFTYSLETTDQSMGDAFLLNFLTRTRTGYCVHFATAAAVLARLRGIPARYVSGFLVSMPSMEEEYRGLYDRGAVQATVTGMNAHAWVELWFPETGWITFEATPPMRPEAYADPAYWERLLSPGSFTSRQLAAVTGGRIGTPIEAREADSAALRRILTTSSAIIAILAVLVALVLSGPALARRISRPERLNAHLGRFRRRGRRIAGLASQRGAQRPEACGWLAWEKTVEELLERNSLASGGNRRLSVFREIFFGGRDPDAGDFDALDTLIRDLRRLPKR